MFPVRGKKPLTVHGFKDATSDPEQINAWYDEWPDAGVALATGDVIVVDVDKKSGGFQSWAKRQWPETWRANTGNGFHLYYQWYPGDGEPLRNSASKLGPGLDIRGQGGYVVLPPSPHEDGGVYEWSNRNYGVPLTLPKWIVEELNDRKRETPADNADGEEPQEGVIPKGGRNQALASIAGKLRRTGLSESELRDALLAVNRERCVPPLPSEEVLRIAASIGEYPPAYPLVVQRKPQSILTPLDWDNPPEEPDWFLEGLIANRDVAMLLGEPSAQKSWLAMSLAVAVAHGDDYWCDIPLLADGPVVYVDEEQDPSEAMRRLKQLGFDPKLDGDRLAYYSQQGVRLDKRAEELHNEIRAINPCMVVLDSLVRFHSEDEQNNMAMARLYNDGIKPLSREIGATVFVLHHTTKADGSPFQRARGAGDLTASIDIGLDVRVNPNVDYRRINVFKPRHRVDFKTFAVAIEDEGNRTHVRRCKPEELRVPW